MKLWSSDSDLTSPLPRAMAKLARFPAAWAWGTGLLGLVLIVLSDGALRSVGLRLVPLYVPLLCAVYWALGGWQAMAFAILAAMVALLPDMLASPTPLGVASISNAIIRSATYMFLALIIGGYRRAYDEADYRAMYDGLTGTLNKLPFQAAVVRQLAAAQREQRTLLAACIDLDGFKGINTYYGHAAGDAALLTFAQGAMRAVRGSDLVGRLGGDEFGFLLDSSSTQNPEALATLLHERVTSALAKTGLPLSCSMGSVIVTSTTTLSASELFGRADALLRTAKANGKAKVLTETAPRSPV